MVTKLEFFCPPLLLFFNFCEQNALEVLLMAILRISISALYFIVASLISLLLFMVRPGSAKNIGLFAKIMAVIPKWLFRLKIEIEGSEFLEISRPCIFVCNHQNSMDFLSSVCIAPANTVSLGKKSLKYIPLFGQLYWLSGNILIDRKNFRKSFETTKQIADRIHNEKLSIWIFPEGTRNYGKGLLPFKNGAFKIANRVNIPVIPVCIGTYNINLHKFKSGVVRVKILPPVTITDDIVADRQSIYNQMKKTIDELDQKVAPPGAPS